MRYLIISDLHANWEALQAVLADSEGHYDRILCLGDLVGYGPDPNLVAEWARAANPLTVRGNHDRACTGLCGLGDFSPLAKAAALWTRTTLSGENVAYLRSLRQGPVSSHEFSLVHGSPRDEDEYLLQSQDAAGAFFSNEHPITFFGHTHRQGGFQMQAGKVSGIDPFGDRATLHLTPDNGYLINPGSTGQPRDGNAEAAYALFTPELSEVRFKRVPYDIAAAQKKIRRAGLPDVLADRLAVGV